MEVKEVVKEPNMAEALIKLLKKVRVEIKRVKIGRINITNDDEETKET
jgi:hypothetical protein